MLKHLSLKFELENLLNKLYTLSKNFVRILLALFPSILFLVVLSKLNNLLLKIICNKGSHVFLKINPVREITSRFTQFIKGITLTFGFCNNSSG